MAQRGSGIVLGLVVALVAGCAAEDEPTPAPTTSGTSSTSSGATSTSGDGLREVSAAPAEVVPESDWLTARLEIFTADSLAAVGDDVFVKTDDGHVVRVDAESAKVTGELQVDTSGDSGRYCLGIGSDGTSLWACSANGESIDIHRIDPATMKVTTRVAVDKVFDQFAIPVVGGRVWVLTGIGDRLTAVDVDTGDTTTKPLGRRCFQLAATETRVYATCSLTDEVIALDPSTGKKVAKVEVPHPVNVSAVGDDVWVSGGGGILRLSADLEPRVLYAGLTAGQEGDLVATDDAVWVRQPEGFLFRIDPSTDAVAAQYTIDPVPSGGGVLVTDDAVWLTAFDDNLLLRLDPES